MVYSLLNMCWVPCALQHVTQNDHLSLSDDKHIIHFSSQYCYLINHIGCENKEIDHQRYV